MSQPNGGNFEEWTSRWSVIKDYWKFQFNTSTNIPTDAAQHELLTSWAGNMNPGVELPLGTQRFGLWREWQENTAHFWYKSWANCTAYKGLHDVSCQKARYYAEQMLKEDQIKQLDREFRRGWLDPILGDKGYYGTLDFSKRVAFTRRRDAELENPELEFARKEETSQWYDDTRNRRAALSIVADEARAEALDTGLAAKYLAKAKLFDSQLKDAAVDLLNAGVSAEGVKERFRLPSDSAAFTAGKWAPFLRGLRRAAGFDVTDDVKDLAFHNFGDDGDRFILAATEALEAGADVGSAEFKKITSAARAQSATQRLFQLFEKAPIYSRLGGKTALYDAQKSLASQKTGLLDSIKREGAVQSLLHFVTSAGKAPEKFFKNGVLNSFFETTSPEASYRFGHSTHFEKLLVAAVKGAWPQYYGEPYPAAGVLEERVNSNAALTTDFQKKFNGLYNAIRRNLTSQWQESSIVYGRTLPDTRLDYENPQSYEYNNLFGYRINPTSKYFPGRIWAASHVEPAEREKPLKHEGIIPRIVIKEGEDDD